MAVTKQAWQYEFGPFHLDVTERLLVRRGQPVALTSKVFDTLVALVESSPRLVTKDELMSRLWPETFVEEATLARNISDLRKALGESSGGERYIETVPRHGYRFVAPVKQLVEETGSLIVQKHTRSRIITQEVVSENNSGADVAGLSLASGSGLRKQPNWLLRPRVLFSFALLVTLAAALIYFGTRKTSRNKARASVSTIAVLPFKYVGMEESDGYMMADALITRLSRIRQIVVRPTGAIAKYNHPEQDALAAGRELGVDSVIDAYIQKSGERVRVSVQLISIEDGSVLWTDQFDSNWTDRFAAQDSISEQVIRALALKLSGEEEKRLAKRYTESAEAYQAYMTGRFWWNKRGAEGFRRAIEFFNEAIALDRNYALPYAGLADCYAIMSPYGVSGPKESYPKARAAATQALAIDDQLAEAHASLANITWLYDWDFAAAEAKFKLATELDPNYPTAHQWYSAYLSSMGRHDEAIREAKRARELDPVSLPIIQDLARAYYHARQYDDAIDTYQKALELNPQYYRLNSWLELAYAQKGLYDQSIETRLRAMSPRVDPKMVAALKDAYVASGWKGYWQKELELTTARSPQNYLFPYLAARIHMRLAENDRALQWLEKAYLERLDHLVLLKVDPIFDPLRGDPRFSELLVRVGLQG